MGMIWSSDVWIRMVSSSSSLGLIVSVEEVDERPETVSDSYILVSLLAPDNLIISTCFFRRIRHIHRRVIHLGIVSDTEL